MPASSGHDDSLSAHKDELGFYDSQSIGLKDLVQKLAELVEDDDHVMVDLAVKWKASGDIVYYRLATVLRGSSDARPNSHVLHPGDENVEVRQSFGVVHVDVHQGSCVVAGGDGVDASVSVVFHSAEPSSPQESHHEVAHSQHEDVDVDIEKVEPHGFGLFEDVVVIQSVENTGNADIAIVGQCSEVVVVSSQPSGETI
ncbi:hypothetical protein ZWY2020_005932 [Hordeum vulgare]|nr:hypothetical protein ZWY2020_005932 [Hordeum vulgare]